jgi:DNA-binding MarR family transcriptional regulator
MTRDQVVGWLEAIVFGGVAVTTEALAYAAREELTFTQWRAILLVGEDDRGCRVGEVAGFLHATLPTTSRLLRRLERRGLLTLERDEEDRRATRARLTEVGADLRSSVIAYRRGEIRTMAAEVTSSGEGDRVLRELAARFDARGHAVRPDKRRIKPESQ